MQKQRASIFNNIKVTLQNKLLKQKHKKRTITLSHNNIYILPSVLGAFFFLVALLNFIMAVNYQNNLILVMAYLMFIVLLISLLAGYSNIKGLTVSMLNTIPTYAAQSPHMIFNLTTDSTCQGVTLSYAYDKRYNSDCENIDEKITELNLPLPFKNRGFYSLPRVKIASHFPFGLITAWSYIDTQECVAIYPKKINPFNNELNTMQASENTDFKNQLLGSDDFNQLIKHSPEMGLQRISWRHYAKTQSLMAKQFIDNESIHTVFDFNQMQGSSEQRLSKLCFLINDAYESNINFTLKLGVKAVCVDTRLDEKSRFLTMLSQFEENV